MQVHGLFRLFVIVFILLVSADARAETVETPKALLQLQVSKPAELQALIQNPEFKAAMATLSSQLIQRDAELRATGDEERYLNSLFRLQLVAGNHGTAKSVKRDKTNNESALTTLSALQKIFRERGSTEANLPYRQYQIFLEAQKLQADEAIEFEVAFKRAFTTRLALMTDIEAAGIENVFNFNIDSASRDFANTLQSIGTKQRLEFTQAVDLVRQFQPLFVYQRILPLTPLLISAERNRRYNIEEVLIPGPDGSQISAVIMRKWTLTKPQPTVLNFTIYADSGAQRTFPQRGAAEGFVSVRAYSRGKAGSSDAIAPYEHEVTDVNAVIDWIAKQPWSNGEVGMYGGSYEGFSQWAATKNLHPALKTIVPYVAAVPGQGLPMENNIFLNANYGWAFYVGNHQYLDNTTYDNRERWNRLNDKWYTGGRAYRQYDQVDGTPNPWFQRWLQHPSYDHYWQAMVPVGSEFTKINIPVLSITGYYDDGQISALHYLRQHEQYNKKANHYLVIGPYDHVGAQNAQKPAMLRNYQIDSVAQLDTPAITFEWLNYILRDGKKPTMLQDKINYQIMGSNTWAHAPSLAALRKSSLRLYLESEAPQKATGNIESTPKKLSLSSQKPSHRRPSRQSINYADRTTSNNNSYYPDPIVQNTLDSAGGLVFTSEPFTKPATIAGSFSGELKLRINKKDVDLGLVLYELTAKGEYFHLSYFIGRASYADDMSVRKLLRPGRVETIKFDRTRMVARQMAPGSRLVLVANVNKNAYAQINHGTGGEVSDETIADGAVPLEIEWLSDSYINIPLQ